MNCGRTAWNVFADAGEVMNFLRTMGSDSTDIVYVSDKALFRATALHLRVRHALTCHEDFVDDSESFDEVSSWPGRELHVLYKGYWIQKSLELAMKHLASKLCVRRQTIF